MKTILKTALLIGLGATLLTAEMVNSPSSNYTKEYKKYDSLAMEAWEKMPFGIKRAILVPKEATGYGMYSKRKSNKYLSGEDILIYVEPIGFGHKDLGNFYRIDMESDLIVQDENGKVLGKLKGFGKFKFDSNERNREIYLSLTISLGKAPAGKYLLIVPIRDNIKNQTAEFKIPVEIIQ